jgi:hypothetical protein
MQKLQTYFGIRVVLMPDLDPIRLDALRERGEKIRQRYDFNPDEYHLYRHTLRIWAEDSHFGVAGGLSRRLKSLGLTFSVNPRQRSAGDIKFLNDEAESELPSGVTLSPHPYEVTFALEGSYFDGELDFRNELILFVRKTVSPAHRKIKAVVRAEPTAAFVERFREKNLQVLSKFDSYLTRPLRLREPSREGRKDVPLSFTAEGAAESPQAVAAPAPARDRIFISYRHVASNRKVLDRLLYQLYDLEKQGRVEPWSDLRIEAGMSWEEEIQRALDSAVVAILLISAEFMASKFIREKEIPYLLERAARSEVTILPLILNAAIQWTDDPKFGAFQSVNPPEKPLLKMSVPERDDYLAKVARRIKALLQSRSMP